ncbi:hypothetical protein TSUD_160160 [Trifolium subterraneum]|uniref:Reverse transcriptase domain-containing protein n=1 Tax=Trifolium subterraneum TaxID=3900 RepID=A0A2Z6M7L5_TRISU|nr:hypothetical protein TSUD_160160 [Trifolium subterraneum]
MLADKVIPKLVTDEVNVVLTMMPSHDEVQAAVFALNKDSAPGPDGFGAFFYQHYWDIVKNDVIRAVLQFFTSSWILPGFNSNIIALLPKTPDASSIDHYRPIAMANFKFKVISKIIADRLASILPSIDSEEQKGFIHDRNIKDCLCIASEAANLLHNKSYGGNLALKIDITKAFDTLDWSFLLKVLNFFGFNEVFCKWIITILHSAYLSVSINGKSHGFFNCSRGVRQGDPLSPLLFCLAEDVLSRAITKLVTQGNVNLIKGTRNFKIPSHSFYADDLLVFCKGNLSGLKTLNDLFDKYALESGQVINTSKSTIFSGSITPGRLNLIVQLLNFKLGSLPFIYLGVPIFRGKPKTCHLQPVADKIKLKLSAWKASLLSIAGRVQLVRSVIQSMLIYSITLYSWPVALLKDIEKCIRNFVWSGDIDKRKLVTISWQKICRPYSQGGLNIISLIKLNAATNLKLCWTLITSQDSWAKLLKDRVIRGRRIIQHHIYSSIWSNIKDEFAVIMNNTFWLLGDGRDINFWNDSWCDNPLSEQLCIPDHISHSLSSTFNSMEDMWKLCDLNWSPQCKITITAAIINLINTLWLVRNQARFNNNFILWRSAISLIIASTALTGNNTSKSSSNSIRDFTVLKMFRITIHHPIPPVLKEIIWQPPLLNWFKCNTYGASSGNPGNASCGGVFRDHNADFVYAFAEPLGFASSYFAELCGAMRAIEIAYDKNWLNIWLETDSSLVVAALKNPTKPVAWPLRNRWRNVLFMINNMNCFVTHIYREATKLQTSLLIMV